MQTISACLAAVAGLFLAQPSLAQPSPDPELGLVLVQSHCAECHAIDKVGSSPLPIAPPLRDLHERYPVEHLEEAFAEGIMTGHSEMPQFRLEPDQIDALIAYLKSLE